MQVCQKIIRQIKIERCYQRSHGHRDKRWLYTPEAVHEKFRQAERIFLSLLDDNAGYQKTGNRKENIDPYKTGSYLTNPGMKQYDKNNSQCSEAINVFSVGICEAFI